MVQSYEAYEELRLLQSLMAELVQREKMFRSVLLCLQRVVSTSAELKLRPSSHSFCLSFPATDSFRDLRGV